MPFSTKNGITLHYDIAGQGPAVCLINGYRLSGGAWPDAFINQLTSRCVGDIIRQSGHRPQRQATRRLRIRQHGNDVLGLLDNLRLQRVHLLGFSMGGAIAQEFAIRHAERLDRLILFGTFCGGIWAEPASYSVFKRLLAADDQSPEDAARQAWPVTYSPEYLAANADAVEQQMRRELEHPTPIFVAQRQMEALRQFDSYRDLPNIRAPTLIATGADDVLVKPRNSQILASRIPNSRLELLADLGHRAIWEAPEEIADLVGDFLTRPITWSQRAPRTGSQGEWMR